MKIECKICKREFNIPIAHELCSDCRRVIESGNVIIIPNKE